MLADELVGCEALERLNLRPKIICVDEVGQVLLKLCVIVVVEALGGGFLDGSIHPLDRSDSSMTVAEKALPSLMVWHVIFESAIDIHVIYTHIG